MQPLHRAVVAELKRANWSRIRDELFAAEWNLLLWAAGSLSDVVCHHTMQVWRTAVDVGSRDRLRLDH